MMMMIGSYYATEIHFNAELHNKIGNIFSLLPLFWKINGGLSDHLVLCPALYVFPWFLSGAFRDHLTVCMTVCPSVCICMYPRNVFVFYASPVMSKESRRSVLPGTSYLNIDVKETIVLSILEKKATNNSYIHVKTLPTHMSQYFSYCYLYFHISGYKLFAVVMKPFWIPDSWFLR
jgi:hypothetical protein